MKLTVREFTRKSVVKVNRCGPVHGYGCNGAINEEVFEGDGIPSLVAKAFPIILPLVIV